MGVTSTKRPYDRVPSSRTLRQRLDAVLRDRDARDLYGGAHKVRSCFQGSIEKMPFLGSQRAPRTIHQGQSRMGSVRWNDLLRS